MVLAAFGDVHGNLSALEAVLAAIEEAGVHTRVCTGDIVVGSEYNNEVIDQIRGLSIPCVQGHADRSVAMFTRKRETLRKTLSPDEFEALESTHDALRCENIEFLAGLPKQLILSVDGIPVCVCHGTPSSQMDDLDEEDPATKFRRQREYTNTRLIICGRTHRPFARTVDGALFVNPGSAGLANTGAKGASLAHYAIVSTEAEPWTAQLLTAPVGAKP